MKNHLLALALLFFSSLSMAYDSVKGYGNTSWGMSPEEVIGAENGKVHKITPPLEYYETLGLVGVDKVEIGGGNFKVVYQFKESKLVQVIVQSIDNKFVNINKGLFQSVDSLLTQKYGSPIYKEPYKEIVWNVSGMNVNLSHTIIDGISNFVTVTYRPESEQAKKSDNL
ncbi:hypothetical protein M5L65_004871 [Citrobacter freundii]|nr:hypothetical protein [Citrobacter freundii]